jgi:hypothetical protein
MPDQYYDAQWRPLIRPFDAVQEYFELSTAEALEFYTDFVLNAPEQDVLTFTADCAHALGKRPSCDFTCK